MFPVVVNAQVYSDKHPTNNNQIVVNDTAGVFTQEQFNEMKNNMIPLLEKGNVMVVTRRSAGERNIEIVADEEYKKVFSTNNGVILVINIYNGADSSGTDADWHNHMTLRGYGTMVLNDNRRNQVYQENRKLLQEAKFLELVKNSFDAVCIFNDIKKYEKESVNASDIEGVVLEDDADILTDEEESKLADIMAPLTEYGHIIFKTMERKEIEEKVREFLIEDLEIDEEKIAPEALLKEDLGIDSLDFVDIVVIVEKKFGFKIKPEEMTEVKTLNQFNDYIQSKVG